MVISNNLSSINTNRYLKNVSKHKKLATEKLSSGYRINRSADDAAGLSISEKMRKQIRGLTQGVENVEDGISLCQVADGALGEVTSMLHRMTELSVQAANDTNTREDRVAINNEIDEILQEIDNISNRTAFNGRKIFRAPNPEGGINIGNVSTIYLDDVSSNLAEFGDAFSFIADDEGITLKNITKIYRTLE